tara:strand:+ start:84 stop:407 length:324 start_codon:yes stop_codon:yes gene_type:complete
MNNKMIINKGIPECSKRCLELGVSCPIKDCKEWIDYDDDANCSSIAIAKNGSMTLREIADRLHVSFVRVKQIEDKTLDKIHRALAREFDVDKKELARFILGSFENRE